MGNTERNPSAATDFDKIRREKKSKKNPLGLKVQNVKEGAWSWGSMNFFYMFFMLHLLNNQHFAPEPA